MWLVPRRLFSIFIWQNLVKTSCSRTPFLLQRVENINEFGAGPAATKEQKIRLFDIIDSQA